MNFGENVVVHFFPTTGISTNCYFTIFKFLADFLNFGGFFQTLADFYFTIFKFLADFTATNKN
jgi:hypothetical protein